MKPVTFAQYVASPPPAPLWVLPGLIPGDGWTLLQAQPKTGKSIFAAQMADCLSRGEPFLGWAAPNGPKRVTYLQFDAPPGDWHGQLTQLGMANSPALTIDRSVVGLFPLDDMAKRQKLRLTLKECALDLLIWDALDKLTTQDLNTKEGCQVTLARIHEVFSGPRLVIHHPRKGSTMAPPGSWANVDEISGNHYLAGDASALLTLKAEGSSAGKLRVLGRMMGSFHSLTRDGDHVVNGKKMKGSYRWLTSQEVTEDELDGSTQPSPSSGGQAGHGSHAPGPSLPPQLWQTPATVTPPGT